LKLLSVQSDSERRVVLEGSTGTTHYGGSNVPNVQTKCATGCDRLHPPCYDNNHTPAITSTKVSLAHYALMMVQLVSGVSAMKQQPILSSPTQVYRFFWMVYMLGIGHTSV
jgi:hypothetical protein